MSSSCLFAPMQIRSVELRNRICVSPMCQYSSEDGFANDWHLVHLGSRAVGGAGLVMMEATAVTPGGRISPADQGIWKDAHIDFLARIAAFLKRQGTVAAIQLAHAGRKASTRPPWQGGGCIAESNGGWLPAAPSALPFHPHDPAPHELTAAEIRSLVDAFAAAARRALAAGFQVVEIHGAHGYLIHEFLSPLSNRRADQYGGSFEKRIRFALEVVEAVRAAWPEELPLWLRISATDWAPGGWALDDSVELAKRVRGLGVDLIDCSSGGLTLDQKIELGPGYQVPFAERIRHDADVMTGAVGLITKAEQAEEIVASGKADVVLVAREFLRNPYWVQHAAKKLGAEPPVPVQYQRAW
ncbi:MAG TPA: NADH:flavin oxidoreductase/NADH oxidase [Bryobacteraceae bacterium]|nr:NADH:flavin oxidoreductase/NADH oxidase [Bryobacteraceae bacterium]